MRINASLPYEHISSYTSSIFQSLASFYQAKAGKGASGWSTIKGPTPEVKAALAQYLLHESRDLLLEDQAILLAIVHFESGFNPAAKNPTSSAYGLFQIVDATWANLGMSKSSRTDIQAQVKAGVSLYRENLRFLEMNRSSGVHGVEKAVFMYTLHHDGLSGKDFGGERIARNHVVGLYKDYINLIGAFN